MGISNEKGARFERSVCSSLSLWISNDRRDDLFWRSATSGGRATLGSRKGRKRKSQMGDISALDSEAVPFIHRFFVECKFYKDLKLQLIWLGSDGRLPEFWDEPYAKAVAAGKTPFCVLKQNLKPPIVWCTPDSYQAFNHAADGRLPLVGTFDRHGVVVHVFHYRAFLTKCDPTKICGRRQLVRESL